MHELPLLHWVHRLRPGLVPGARLHHAALDAAASGRWEQVPTWVAAAAEAYRIEMAVEPLARLRVHELMFSVRRPGGDAREGDVMQEIVRRVNRLDTLETLAPPHERMDARVVLAHWVGEAPGLVPSAGRRAA